MCVWLYMLMDETIAYVDKDIVPVYKDFYVFKRESW
jgi:hypothetical protein